MALFQKQICTGDHAVMLQAGGDINLAINIVTSPLRDVAEKLMQSIFGEFPQETKERALRNLTAFIKAVTEKKEIIVVEQDELSNVVNSPDFLYVAKQALIAAARESNADIHEQLSLLLIERIKKDDDDFEKIILNESILTVPKLLNSQIDMLSLIFLVYQFKNPRIITSGDFLDFLHRVFVPLGKSVSKQKVSYAHLAFAGVGAVVSGQLMDSIEHAFLLRYPGVFCTGFHKDEFDLLGLPKCAENLLIPSNHNDSLFQVDASNDSQIYEKCSRIGINEHDADKLKDLQNSKKMNVENLTEWLNQKCPEIKELSIFWRKARWHLSLSSVGLAIAINNIRLRTNEKIFLQDWL